MQWTDDRQIHIHTVLHQNKNDEHARGHIGTELNNKAETIMQVEVDKEDKTVSVVEAVHIRDREFEPFAFRINEEAMPEPVEFYLPKEKKTGRPTKGPFDPDKEIPKNVHRPALDAVFANGNISNYDDYIERLKEGYGLQGIKLGYNKAVKVATLLSDKQMVIKKGKIMPSIQNTIIEFNFTLLSGRIYKNKAKSAGRHHVRYSYSPLF